jgi:hypothetical protein
MLVLAVLVVAAGLAVPTLRGLAGATPLNAGSDMVQSAWAQARSRAMTEGRAYRFAAKDGSGQFHVAPDGSDYWDGNTPRSSPGDNSQPGLVIDDSLPGDIRFSNTPDAGNGAQGQGNSGGGDWGCVICFLPDGTVQQDATISFGQNGSRPLVLSIQSSTGAVTTSR